MAEGLNQLARLLEQEKENRITSKSRIKNADTGKELLVL
jgi:hypothetical protein